MGPLDPGVKVVTTGRLDPGQAREVQDLVARATEVDQVQPLSEHVALHLRYGGDEPVKTVLALIDDRIVGYGHLDVTDKVEGASAELVVDPLFRKRGVGRAMLHRMLVETSPGILRLWAHGEHPAAAALAGAMGFVRVRCLWQMRRSLSSALQEPVLPPGVTVRTFEPGRDDEAWVALNARAFAGHPEQGSWTVEDLRRRMCEPWFDPAGFFLAERDNHLVGFHWTKVHGNGAGDGHGHEPIGEVYVVGVDPAEQGNGLGSALTTIGLSYLRARELPQAMLYVDESNTAAIKVYERLGFTHWETDVMYRHDGSERP
jgi:mycothiol synthase